MATNKNSSPGPFLRTVEIVHDRIPDATRYPFTLPAVRHLGKLLIHPKVSFLVGENGSGKSTLVEAMAVACGMNAEGGSQNFNFSSRATHSGLHECLRIARAPAQPRLKYFLRAESFYNVVSGASTRLCSISIARSFASRSQRASPR